MESEKSAPLPTITENPDEHEAICVKDNLDENENVINFVDSDNPPAKGLLQTACSVCNIH